MCRATGVVIAMLLVSGDVPAMAQTGGGAAGEKKAERDGYDGVVPGSSIVPPGAPWRNKRHVPVFWIGFQPRGGSSRFFVQLGRDVDYQQRMVGNVLIVDLPGARLANSNARRPLVTRYFDSAVAELSARQVGRRRAGKRGPRLPAGVELRIAFVNPGDAAPASASLSREADGFHYLYLDFGPGSGGPNSEGSDRGRVDDADDPDPALDD